MDSGLWWDSTMSESTRFFFPQVAREIESWHSQGWVSLIFPHSFFKHRQESFHCNSKWTGYWGGPLLGLLWTYRCTVKTHQGLRPAREPLLLHWPTFSKKTSRWTMHFFLALRGTLHLALSPSPARFKFYIFLDWEEDFLMGFMKLDFPSSPKDIFNCWHFTLTEQKPWLLCTTPDHNLTS